MTPVIKVFPHFFLAQSSSYVISTIPGTWCELQFEIQERKMLDVKTVRKHFAY